MRTIVLCTVSHGQPARCPAAGAAVRAGPGAAEHALPSGGPKLPAACDRGAAGGLGLEGRAFEREDLLLQLRDAAQPVGTADGARRRRRRFARHAAGRRRRGGAAAARLELGLVGAVQLRLLLQRVAECDAVAAPVRHRHRLGAGRGLETSGVCRARRVAACNM